MQTTSDKTNKQIDPKQLAYTPSDVQTKHKNPSQRKSRKRYQLWNILGWLAEPYSDTYVCF